MKRSTRAILTKRQAEDLLKNTDNKKNLDLVLDFFKQGLAEEVNRTRDIETKSSAYIGLLIIVITMISAVIGLQPEQLTNLSYTVVIEVPFATNLFVANATFLIAAVLAIASHSKQEFKYPSGKQVIEDLNLDDNEVVYKRKLILKYMTSYNTNFDENTSKSRILKWCYYFSMGGIGIIFVGMVGVIFFS